ncbi:MAG: hypothetical protein ABIP20_01920, partial [Chthoniobacteraceae bacterium]
MHQAEKAKVLSGFAGGRISRALETPEVDNVESGPLRFLDLTKQPEVIFLAARLDAGRAIGPLLEGRAKSDKFRRGAGLRQSFTEAVGVSVAIRKDDPKDTGVIGVAGVPGERSGAFPGRHMEPSVDSERGGCRGDGLRFTGIRKADGIEPVNAPLKRVCREWNAAPLRIGVQRIPAHFQTGKPQAASGGEENFRVRLAFVVVAQTGNRQHGSFGASCGMLLRKDAESPARPGFEQDWVFGLPERLQRIVKARGVICMPRPVIRVGGVGVCDPTACDIRDERNA